jgi:hypothetical protein
MQPRQGCSPRERTESNERSIMDFVTPDAICPVGLLNVRKSRPGNSIGNTNRWERSDRLHRTMQPRRGEVRGSGRNQSPVATPDASHHKQPPHDDSIGNRQSEIPSLLLHMPTLRRLLQRRLLIIQRLLQVILRPRPIRTAGSGSDRLHQRCSPVGVKSAGVDGINALSPHPA